MCKISFSSDDYFKSKVQATYSVLIGKAKSKIYITAIRVIKRDMVRVTVVERFIMAFTFGDYFESKIQSTYNVLSRTTAKSVSQH